MTEPQPKPRRRPRGQRIAAGLACALVLVVLAAMAIKFFVAPGLIRTRIEAALAQRWDGRADIESVGFNWTGSIVLTGVDLYDAADRRWARAESVKLTLGGMLGSGPVLHGVSVDGLILRRHYGPGVRSPIKPAPEGPAMGVDLRNVRVQITAFELVDTTGRTQTWRGLDLRGVPAPEGLQVAIRPIGPAAPTPQASGSMAIDGVIDTRTWNCNLTLQMNCSIAADEMAAIFASMGRAELMGSGRVAATMTFEGPLSDPGALRVLGDVDLTDWDVRDDVGVLTEKVTARVRFTENRRVEVSLPTGAMFAGQAQGSAFLERSPAGAFEYGGDLTVEDVDMTRLGDLLGLRFWPDKGRLTGQGVFSGRSDGFDSFRARAQGVLEDADMMNLPIVPGLIGMLGVSDLGGLQSSSLAATWTMAGPTITIGRANLANAVSALEAQPGGVINLQTHALNLYVVGVPIKHLTPLLNLPVVSLLSNLGKKLTRMHVEGPWTDPLPSLVRVEPLSNVGGGTLEFFGSVAKGGGKLGGGILRGLADLAPGRSKPAAAP